MKKQFEEAKTETIIVRVEPSLKKKMLRQAKRGLSSYARLLFWKGVGK